MPKDFWHFADVAKINQIWSHRLGGALISLVHTLYSNDPNSNPSEVNLQL